MARNKSPYERIADAAEVTSRTLEKMESNLKVLNDSNILHQTKVAEEHKNIQEKLKDVTTKYWYLVLIAFILLALLAGVKEAAKLIPSVMGGG